MLKILIIHGPNLNILGEREKNIYGNIKLKAINDSLYDLAKELTLELEIVQTNHEGEMVEIIQKSNLEFKGIIINPAAYTHTSIAILDALKAVALPTIEVHISNIYAREEFRHKSYIAPIVKGRIMGLGIDSYLLGLRAMYNILKGANT